MAAAPTSLDGQLVLAVFAHPDDESIACGGTLARLADLGAHVVVMLASHGELSPDRTGRDPHLAHVRSLELKEAAAALGVREVILLNHPDGQLRWGDVTAFNAELVLFMRDRRPAAVLTFDEDGLYWHPDHIGVFERVLSAVRSLGPEAPPLYAVTMRCGVMTDIVELAKTSGWTAPDRGFWSLHPDAFGKFAVPATLAVDVADWVPRKLEALAAYRSQMGVADPFSTLSVVDARRLLGREYFRRLDPAPGGAAIIERICTPNS
jgi:N-acetyl-1-D-myo-inositol-2-amino-2-deoxy-alpha-D-glucopyranoside deacetylase